MSPIPLDRPRVLEHARAIVADRGLEALSVRTVAADLGVTPMALYRYVASAEELRAAVVEACVAELPEPAPGPEDPIERYRAWATGARATLLGYPGLGRHLLLHWFELPSMLTAVEGLLAIARELGFTGFDQVGVANAVFSFVLARVDLEETLAAGDALRRQLPLAAGDPPGAYPLLRAQIDEYRLARVDAHFGFGLELLLSGVAVAAAT
jgi:AcrR family transcriptional regulator